MSSSTPVVCREVFDENSQPSAEEISEYAQQLGIDPESETHLLPLARDGLMQALPAPWRAYFDEKLQTHYYYNEDTKKTQWEHPLDNIYKDLVKKARDASMHDDTCASVQELLTSEENTKHLERVETKVESDDDDLTTDSGENQPCDVKEPNTTTLVSNRRLAPLGRPPLAPITRFDKKLGDLRVSPLRRSADNPVSPKPSLFRNQSDKELMHRFEKPKLLFKQQSDAIDLKIPVCDDDGYSPLLLGGRLDRGLTLSGKGNMFLRVCKSDLPSPDTDKSNPLESLTKSDPPKGILREKLSDALQRKAESLSFGKPRSTASFEEDRKSVRFKLENVPETTLSPGSNSSSELNDGQSSIISAPIQAPSPNLPSSPVILSPTSPVHPSTSPSVPLLNPSIVLSPIVHRPPLPPKIDVKERKIESNSERDLSLESDSKESRGTSPRRRVVRPPAADYIKPDLFQKNFQKISDLVRQGDETSTLDVDPVEKEIRPRSPLIPLKNKISINLMESIESETSLESPDREFANLDLNDLDESNDIKSVEKDKDYIENGREEKVEEILSPKIDSVSEKISVSLSHRSSSHKSPKFIDNVHVPQIIVPKIDLSPRSPKEFDDSKHSIKEDTKNKTDSSEIRDKTAKISPTPSITTDLRSPRFDYSRQFTSPFSTFKPLNKAVVNPLKSSDSSSSFGKGLSSPRLDGVILSQGKSSTDNVVVVYQFENQDDKPKSPLIPDVARETIERAKGDERRRLELSLQKELESLRVEWSGREKKMRSELQTELKETEERFLNDKRMRLSQQAEKHKQELEEIISNAEHTHQEKLQKAMDDLSERCRRDIENAEKLHLDRMSKLTEEYHNRLIEQQERLRIENERALTELREQLQAILNKERARMQEENRSLVESLREEHTARIADLRHDYRAEVERLRTQHACHLEELRARLANERAAATKQQDDVTDKYKCLKQKYARLKHDVKMSIERRNKRREMSMTTGSETEKSNSHKQQSLERCKEANETSVSVIIEQEPVRVRLNNNPTIKYNDNETSYSESNTNNKCDNNNEEWKKREASGPSAESSQTSAPKQIAPRKIAVAFREPPRRRHHREKDNGTTTDFQDSSDATTADEKPKESVNGHGRRRCFTRLKSASTSRLNYSPKRGEGWSSPLEALRQQLRKLDDLEDQFPDLACQPAYSLRYPFAEFGPVPGVSPPELEFVRHRALVEREGMRRARAAIKQRSQALKETNAVHRAPSEEREATELEVALHRARALLGEKEIRLRHIERALRRLAESHPPPLIQEATTSDGSSGPSEAEIEAGGAVLKSLRALHADVRDIWRALDASRPHTATPEPSSLNIPSPSQARITLSPQPQLPDQSDGNVTERARGLRAWLQTAP